MRTIFKVRMVVIMFRRHQNENRNPFPLMRNVWESLVCMPRRGLNLTPSKRTLTITQCLVSE